jgi:sulfur-carrier protein adenylyltransferase/sulfurtransferase
VFGTLQALEALKLILGLPGLTNEIVLIDLLTLEQRKLRTSRRTQCNHEPVIASRQPSPTLEVTFTDLDPAVSAGYKLIDIREPQEVRELPIARAPSTHIPLATLLGDTEPLSRAERYLLVCARGSRSRAAAEYLRERGFTQAYSLKGGLAAVSSKE